jgi:hypothetical protein
MSKAAGGLRHRHRPDVMQLLARAHPASLDPGAAPPADEVAARLMAAEGAPLADGAGPPWAGRARLGAPAQQAPRARQAPRTRRAILAGTGLTVIAGGVAVAVLAATAGGGAPPRARRGQQPVLLTVATVRQVAAASRSALANSGRAVVTYRTTQNGALQDSGTDTITFSGKNWNDAFSQTFPAAAGQPGHTQFAINRIVGGQFYLYIAGRTPRLLWYHDTNPSGHPSFTIPDPRTVLRALAPSARFVAAGYQVIGGVRLKELRATNLSHVAGLSALPDVGPGTHVTSLEVWVDGHGVVHRIGLEFKVITTVWHMSYLHQERGHKPIEIVIVQNNAAKRELEARMRLAKARAPFRVIVRVAPLQPDAAQRQVQLTTLTVTFSGIGQPQRITAPRHAIQQYGHG